MLVSSQSLAYSCPNYEFKRNLIKGNTDEDIRVIQEILNLDKRTIVAYTGLGSKGNETPLFGKGTRESLKRFQALFIEYIGVADGKFNDKTRASMNTVCKGPFFTGQSKSVYDTASTTKDFIAPIVGIAAVASTTADVPFRAYIGASEAIKTPTLDGLIVDGATAGDVRKTSSTTFTFLVTPNADVKGKITLQFEADSVSDLAGNKNSEASNEWTVYVLSVSQASTTTDLPTLADLAIPTLTNTDCSTVSFVSATDYTNPCYGKVPTSPVSSADLGQEKKDEKKDNQIMQMLQGLMQGLAKALGGGGQQTGGKTGGDAACGCVPIPTTQYTPIGPGIGGRQGVLGVAGGGGNYVGKQSAPPPICGVRPRSGPKDKCGGIPGPHTGNCCGITSDMTMMPVTGTLEPSPTGMRSGGF